MDFSPMDDTGFYKGECLNSKMQAAVLINYMEEPLSKRTYSQIKVQNPG